MPAKMLVNRVEAKIRALFREGLPLTADVLHYIEATAGAADPVAVAELLIGPDDDERDTLLELVFFPDFGFQCDLEKVLAGRGLSRRDRLHLAMRLKDDPASARLLLADDPQPLDCQLPIEGVDALLIRLNLAWSLDAHLRQTLAHWSAGHGGETASDFSHLIVKLRNADLGQSPSQIGVLRDFLERMPPDDRRWEACFDFLMVFLAEHGDTVNYYQALMVRKRFLVHHLLKARRNAARMARSNMETLHMSGFRAAYFDEAAARQALMCIDAIALAIYGRTEHFDEAPVRVDLGQVGDAWDIAGIVRRLS